MSSLHSLFPLSPPLHKTYLQPHSSSTSSSLCSEDETQLPLYSIKWDDPRFLSLTNQIYTLESACSKHFPPPKGWFFTSTSLVSVPPCLLRSLPSHISTLLKHVLCFSHLKKKKKKKTLTYILFYLADKPPESFTDVCPHFLKSHSLNPRPSRPRHSLPAPTHYHQSCSGKANTETFLGENTSGVVCGPFSIRPSATFVTVE